MNEPQNVPEIDATTAKAQVDSGAVLLLDVREDDEWQAGHAPQATHAVLGALDPGAIPRDRPVVAVCRSGKRASAAAHALAAAGHDVRNLTGGMQAWAATGLPVVASDGSPGKIV